VCYDGSVKKNSKDCPILPIAVVSDVDAGRYVDSYGMAVAQAKQNSYTRVNMYTKDASWFANVLFTNSQTGDIYKVLLKIDGKTGDVSCITGCEYFSPASDIAPVSNPTSSTG